MLIHSGYDGFPSYFGRRRKPRLLGFLGCARNRRPARSRSWHSSDSKRGCVRWCRGRLPPSPRQKPAPQQQRSPILHSPYRAAEAACRRRRWRQHCASAAQSLPLRPARHRRSRKNAAPRRRAHAGARAKAADHAVSPRGRMTSPNPPLCSRPWRSCAGHCRERRLAGTPLPAMATLKDGGFLLLAKADDTKALVQSPRSPRPTLMTREELEAAWDGRLVLMTRRAALVDLTRRFDISWFLGAIHKYRRLLGEVLVASFFLQLF